MSGYDKQKHQEKYGAHQANLYAIRYQGEPMKQAFFFPAITEYLKSKAKGKRILDIGCGPGKWSCYAVECGAKSVDGFDIQEDMVKLAKQATAQYGSSVSICAGDVMKMPYDDNTFEIAMSLYVIPALRQEAYVRHFEELYRLLIPGGKAVVVNFAKSAFDTMFLTCGANQDAVAKKVQDRLLSLSSAPTEKEINDAFEGVYEVLLATFAVNKDGRLFKITDVNHLFNGQVVWVKNQAMVFPDHYYDEQFLHNQIKASGLHIDHIESYCTEERRLIFNSSNGKLVFDKTFTDDPPFQFYHLSKPYIDITNK